MNEEEKLKMKIKALKNIVEMKKNNNKSIIIKIINIYNLQFIFTIIFIIR